MTRFLPALALGATFLLVAAGLKYAGTSGIIEAEIAQRAVQVAIGLGLASFANLAPKRLSRQGLSLDAEAQVQAARRIGGWSLTLAGLAHAVIWALAPLNMAPIASIVVVGAALTITVAYAVRACRALNA